MLSFHTKDICPVCKNKAKEVSAITVKFLVKDEYLKELSSVKDFFIVKLQIVKLSILN